MSVGLVLLAGGQGKRFGGGADKVLLPIAGRPLLAHALSAFLETALITQVCIVVQDAAHQAHIEETILAPLKPHTPILWAYGGLERQDSVLAGLEALSGSAPRWVFIHDGARACITPRAIKHLLDATQAHGAAILGRRVTDTLKRPPPGATKGLIETVDRTHLWMAETPQGFDYALILAAHRAHPENVTDDSALATLAGHPTVLVENPDPNPKLTTPADLPYITFLLSNR
jgi:2-C-methyl-D-erythritol 4-phosphate cytidylyltransferase